jgi:hypothetical protein
MKRLSAVIIIGLFFSGFCFAQTQTGDASYNASKTGLTISHASMSFNTRVKVTNLRNNMEVIATVNARIPAADPRVADVSKEAGDAIGMSPTGHTQVRLEQLPPQQEAPVVVPPAAAPPEADPPPVPPPPQAAAATPATPTVSAPAVATSTVTTRAPIEEPIVETIVVSESPAQYLLAPYSPAPACPAYPLVILILLILMVLLLTAILVLLLCMRRIPYGINAPWYYPVWVRRRLRYLKKHRR